MSLLSNPFAVFAALCFFGAMYALWRQQARLTEALAQKAKAEAEAQAALLAKQEALAREEQGRAQNEELRKQVEQARFQEAAAKEQAALRAQQLAEHQAQTREHLQQVFEALSSQALKSNNKTFIELAEQSLAKAQAHLQGELEQRKSAVEQMIKPLTEQLDALRRRSEEMERLRKGEDESLKALMSGMRQTQEFLHKETSALANALRRSHVRGRWGEVVLEQLFQWAGLREGVHYDKQISTRLEDSELLRPDFVVYLPGKRQVIIDSKTVLDAHLSAMQEDDPAKRGQFLAEHARQLREKVDSLAKKAYWERFEAAPEFVVLFLPADVFLDAALEQDHALFERAFSSKIILATPGTLMAMLKVIERSWKDVAMTENALEIAKQGRELMDRLVKFWEHLANVGHGLEEAAKSYNQAVGSLTNRVLPASRRLLELEVKPTKETDWKKVIPKEVETLPRQMGLPPQ